MSRRNSAQVRRAFLAAMPRRRSTTIWPARRSSHWAWPDPTASAILLGTQTRVSPASPSTRGPTTVDGLGQPKSQLLAPIGKGACPRPADAWARKPRGHPTVAKAQATPTSSGRASDLRKPHAVPERDPIDRTVGPPHTASPPRRAFTKGAPAFGQRARSVQGPLPRTDHHPRARPNAGQRMSAWRSELTADRNGTVRKQTYRCLLACF